jgi:2,3-bisphosphoglycerate-independent phosphoglycerate mutase
LLKKGLLLKNNFEMKPLILIILDGWGIAPPGPGNAISQITTHTIASYWDTFPHTELFAAGTAVGLPEDEAGNSETGHLNIGAGRVVDQDLTRINRTIADSSFYTNRTFLEAIENSKKHTSNIHIMGLLSDAGVHASSGHLLALLKIMEDQQVSAHVYLHLFTDGRDSLPKSSISIYKQLTTISPLFTSCAVATVMGRYYGMDRDERWERTERAFAALTDTSEFRASTFEEAVTTAYSRSETDEFIKPTILTDSSGSPYPRIQKQDSVIFFNYRVDRTRQITKVLMERVPNLFFVTMTEYETGIPCHVAYTPMSVSTPIGMVIEKENLRQLHAAESEKERFVTYYINGLKELPFAHEERVIIPSPKIATYDLAPAMSAISLTDAVIDAMKQNDYALIIMNYANPDMVGHSGSVKATVEACETVDTQVQRVVEAVLSQGGTAVITADHGHAEEMLSLNGEIQTEHTQNHVPFIVCSKAFTSKNITLPHGSLCDIAPTILSILNIPKPTDMTGKNLLEGVV